MNNEREKRKQRRQDWTNSEREISQRKQRLQSNSFLLRRELMQRDKWRGWRARGKMACRSLSIFGTDETLTLPIFSHDSPSQETEVEKGTCLVRRCHPRKHHERTHFSCQSNVVSLLSNSISLIRDEFDPCFQRRLRVLLTNTASESHSHRMQCRSICNSNFDTRVKREMKWLKTRE